MSYIISNEKVGEMQYIPFLFAIIFAIGILSVAANNGYIPGWAPIYEADPVSEGFESGAPDCKVDPITSEMGQPLIAIQSVNGPLDDTISHILHRTAFQSTPQMSKAKTDRQLYVQHPALMYDGIWTRTDVKPTDITGKMVRSDWTIIKEELLYPTHTVPINKVFPANDYHKVVDPTMLVPPYISQPTWSACGDQYDQVVGESTGISINGL